MTTTVTLMDDHLLELGVIGLNFYWGRVLFIHDLVFCGKWNS